MLVCMKYNRYSTGAHASFKWHLFQSYNDLFYYSSVSLISTLHFILFVTVALYTHESSKCCLNAQKERPSSIDPSPPAPWSSVHENTTWHQKKSLHICSFPLITIRKSVSPFMGKITVFPHICTMHMTQLLAIYLWVVCKVQIFLLLKASRVWWLECQTRMWDIQFCIPAPPRKLTGGSWGSYSNWALPTYMVVVMMMKLRRGEEQLSLF